MVDPNPKFGDEVISSEGWRLICDHLGCDSRDLSRDPFDLMVVAYIKSTRSRSSRENKRQEYSKALKAANTLSAFFKRIRSHQLDRKPLDSAFLEVRGPDRLLGRVRKVDLLVPDILARIDEAVVLLQDSLWQEQLIPVERKSGVQRESLSREFLIENACQLFKSITGRQPPSSESGPFVEIIAELLKAAGESRGRTGKTVKTYVTAWKKKEGELSSKKEV